MRILSIILSFICLAGTAQTIEQATRSLSESTEVRDGRFSFYAVDLESGTPIIAHDIDRKMSPASTMKLLTTYAALDILGTDHRFETRVGYQGTINESGQLVGDLIIIAGGDPTLDSEDYWKGKEAPLSLADRIVQSLKDRGVQTIRGGINIEESIYSGIDVPDEWTWQDMGNYYGAGAHAFTFAENRFNIYFNSTAKAGTLTNISRIGAQDQSYYPVNNVKAAAINSDQAYVYSSPGSNRMTIHGRIPLSKTDFKVKAAMPNPAVEFKSRLEEALKEAGIQYEYKDLVLPPLHGFDGTWIMEELFLQYSPYLIDITAYTNMKSNNLYAEHLLRQIGKARKGEGSFAKGTDAMMDWCRQKKISVKGLRVKDGSGLSRADLVSSRAMIELLTALSKETYFDEFMKALPCAGKSGSMKRVGVGSSIAGKMYAKTGYIEGVRAYSGFLEKQNGGSIAFCIMANDYDMSASAMRQELSKLMVKLGQTPTPKVVKTAK